MGIGHKECRITEKRKGNIRKISQVKKNEKKKCATRRGKKPNQEKRWTKSSGERHGKGQERVARANLRKSIPEEAQRAGKVSSRKTKRGKWVGVVVLLCVNTAKKNKGGTKGSKWSGGEGSTL